jgi:hypothetical protein
LTEDLNKRGGSAKFVPRVLTIEHGSSVATNLLEEAEADQNFMEGITTGDKAWVYRYDPETKRESSCGSRLSLQNRRKCVSCVPK